MKGIYLLVLIFIYGCADESNKDFQEKSLQEVKELVKSFPIELTNDLKRFLQNNSNDTILQAFYKGRTELVWFNNDLLLNSNGDSLMKLLNASLIYGINPIKFELEKIASLISSENFIESELLLTKNYITFGQAISNGQIQEVKDYYNFERRVIDTNWLDLLESGVNNQTVVANLLSLQPKNDEYVRLQKGVTAYLSRVTLTDSIIEVNSYRKDSIKTDKLARKALVLHGVITNHSISDSLLIEGVKKFQYEHGLISDGIIGKGTAKELSRSTNYFYNQAKVSLEKWRWTKNFEEEYLLVNIATYKMKCYQHNKLIETKRVVVGTNKTRTPELDSKLSYMIAYPYWHVPRSIIDGELIAKAKNDSTYLSRNGYELFKGGQLVNSNTVDWSAGSNYKFRQKGGIRNALGEVKFIFKNKYSVYFHDTPSKRFFKKGRRSFSHGCIRVNEPLKLVDYLLQTDSANLYDLDSVNYFIAKKERKVISFNKNMAVHIRYYTVEADTGNNIRFYPDVYFKDEDLIKYDF